MKKDYIIRLLKYLLGYCIVAVGINISKMAGLGISPSSSLPGSLEGITGLSLGTMSFAVNSFTVLLQYLVLRKDFKLKNALGIPAALVFGLVIDFFGINPSTFGHLLYNFPRPDAYVLKLVYMLVSIICIAVGVDIYVKQDIVPLPAEGLAAAISFKTGKPFGDCKTLTDSCTMIIALILQLIFLGGLASFTGEKIAVREGTIIAGFSVGQVIKLINKLLVKKNHQ